MLDEDRLDAAVGPLGALERLVRVVDVGLVVLVVVDLASSRASIVRLERAVVVWQVGEVNAIAAPLLGCGVREGYAPRRSAESQSIVEVSDVELRGDQAPRAEAGAAGARRDLACIGRGPLQALPGLREQAERDPRQARRSRPRQREPGLLGGARAEGRPLVRDRRDQEPRDLLRAPRRRRRRARRRDRRPDQA